MARKLIETISPQKVYNRVILGIIIAFVSYFFWESLFPQVDPTIKWIAFAFGLMLFLSGWWSVTNPMRAIRYAQNAGQVVGDLVEKWSPQNFKVEHELEKSLHNYLKKELPWVKVTRQYGSGRVKCDIAVGNDVMIELKSGFKSTQKLQRLIGQLELYKKEWEKPIIVVLAGETEEDLLHDLNSHARQLDEIRIITKETVKLADVADET